jgi:hypothetical protein
VNPHKSDTGDKRVLYVVLVTITEEVARRLAATFQSKSAAGMSGVINVRTECWNSNDGLRIRGHKSQVWGGRRLDLSCVDPPAWCVFPP